MCTFKFMPRRSPLKFKRVLVDAIAWVENAQFMLPSLGADCITRPKSMILEELELQVEGDLRCQTC